MSKIDGRQPTTLEYLQQVADEEPAGEQLRTTDTIPEHGQHQNWRLQQRAKRLGQLESERDELRGQVGVHVQALKTLIVGRDDVLQALVRSGDVPGRVVDALANARRPLHNSLDLVTIALADAMAMHKAVVARAEREAQESAPQTYVLPTVSRVVQQRVSPETSYAVETSKLQVDQLARRVRSLEADVANGAQRIATAEAALAATLTKAISSNTFASFAQDPQLREQYWAWKYKSEQLEGVTEQLQKAQSTSGGASTGRIRMQAPGPYPNTPTK